MHKFTRFLFVMGGLCLLSLFFSSCSYKRDVSGVYPQRGYAYQQSESFSKDFL